MSGSCLSCFFTLVAVEMFFVLLNLSRLWLVRSCPDRKPRSAGCQRHISATLGKESCSNFGGSLGPGNEWDCLRPTILDTETSLCIPHGGIENLWELAFLASKSLVCFALRPSNSLGIVPQGRSGDRAQGYFSRTLKRTFISFLFNSPFL